MAGVLRLACACLLAGLGLPACAPPSACASASPRRHEKEQVTGAIMLVWLRAKRAARRSLLKTLTFPARWEGRGD